MVITWINCFCIVRFILLERICPWCEGSLGQKSPNALVQQRDVDGLLGIIGKLRVEFRFQCLSNTIFMRVQ